MDVVTNELLGVLLEHLVDLVEQVVEVGLQLVALGRVNADVVGAARAALGALLLDSLLFSSYIRSTCLVLREGHLPSDSFLAILVSVAVPRKGSSIGTRCKGSLAEIEDHRIPVGRDDLIGVSRHALAAKIGPGESGGL